MIELDRSASWHCWVCESESLTLAKAANISDRLSSKSFAITDYHYGQTGEIYRCQNCGFLQCPTLDNVLPFYEKLEDIPYEETRQERKLQAKKLLEVLQRYRSGGRLLDIGAGSGILVEQALNMGYDAEGLEPSKWLQQQAQNYNLPVFLGSFPNSELRKTYDIVTLIDVIEHVPNPKEIISNVAQILSEDGILIVATPDVNSAIAQILGWKWWHFRVAHIGYFDRKTLNHLLESAGFHCLKLTRPTWYFTVEYLVTRINQYFPERFQLPIPNVVKPFVLPLNLGDSILGIYQLKRKSQ